MSLKVISIDDDGAATLACDGEMNALEMSGIDEGGLDGLLGDSWAQRPVALDLSEASYMDSAAIGWLLSLHKAFEDAGGKLVLFGIHPNIRKVIDIMRIDQVLNIAGDRDAAMKRLGGGKADG